MGKGLPRSLSGNSPKQIIHRAMLPLRSVLISTLGATGVGWGTAPIGGFPQGNILFLGAACSLSFAGSGADAGLGDTWAGDFSVGTTPADDATITGADVDLIPSTPLAPATAEASPITRGVSTANAVIHDNTAGALSINLNLLIDDVDISADGVPILVDGFVALSYVVLGDD
jgi:hypothetical protein